MENTNQILQVPTLIEQFENYLEYRKDLRPTTIFSYQQVIKRAKELWDIPIDQIKYSDIKRLYSNLRFVKGYKPASIEILNNVLHPVFDQAVKDDIIIKNPTQGALRDIAKGESWRSHHKSAITAEAQKAFLNFVQMHPVYRRWENLFIFLFGTGVRIGEAIALRWEDVNFKKKEIKIQRTLYYQNGIYYDGPTKTEAGLRTIPMLPEVAQALARENQIQKLTKVKINGNIPGRKGLVFVNSKGKSIYPSTVNKTIEAILKEYNKLNPDCPIPRFSVHQIRHSFCSRLCEQDVNLKVIQTVMGHSNFETTMDVYAEVSEQKKQIVFDGLEGKIII